MAVAIMLYNGATIKSAQDVPELIDDNGDLISEDNALLISGQHDDLVIQYKSAKSIGSFDGQSWRAFIAKLKACTGDSQVIACLDKISDFDNYLTYQEAFKLKEFLTNTAGVIKSEQQENGFFNNVLNSCIGLFNDLDESSVIVTL